MADKLKIAIYWAASCGGCDVSLLDIEDNLFDLTAMADILYWPVAMDFKLDDLRALPEKSLDIGLFNGAVRLSEQQEGAELMRSKCKILVAYGSCACFGGIPGLANLADRERIFDVAYRDTVSTENPEDTRPQKLHREGSHELTLPDFFDTVRTLDQTVEVDAYLPGCPPPTERILDLVGIVRDYAEKGVVPPSGAVIAHEKALCDSCPRNATRRGTRLAKVNRPHELLADPSVCLLDQGILCLGIVTRGGCGATCIQANMPCRGCFGPTPTSLDPGAEAISTIGSIAGEANENDVNANTMKKAVRSIRDPAGTFYRFTLPIGFMNRAVEDKPQK